MRQMCDSIQSNQAYFEDFITRSVYHSNAIEGNTLSYAETYAILFNDNSIHIRNAKPRELYEAINLKYALSYAIKHVAEDLSEDFIKAIAIHINKNISEIEGYRKHNVLIQGAEHLPPDANQVSQAMMYFIFNYNRTQYDDVYEKIADNHIKLERIHPFADGNGRTGRILINYELLKNNLPPIVILQEDRRQYFEYLSKQDLNRMRQYFRKLSEKEQERIHYLMHTGIAEKKQETKGKTS